MPSIAILVSITFLIFVNVPKRSVRWYRRCRTNDTCLCKAEPMKCWYCNSYDTKQPFIHWSVAISKHYNFLVKFFAKTRSTFSSGPSSSHSVSVKSTRENSRGLIIIELLKPTLASVRDCFDGESRHTLLECINFFEKFKVLMVGVVVSP